MSTPRMSSAKECNMERELINALEAIAGAYMRPRIDGGYNYCEVEELRRKAREALSKVKGH